MTVTKHRNTRLADDRRKAGRCVRCGGERDSHKLNCESCLRKRRDKMSWYRDQDLKYRVAQYKQGARRRDIPWELSDRKAIDLFSMDCCYCGQAGHGIDRIDSNQGYTNSNCQPCCSRCNIAKNNMTHEEFLSLVKLIADHNHL